MEGENDNIQQPDGGAEPAENPTDQKIFGNDEQEVGPIDVSLIDEGEPAVVVEDPAKANAETPPVAQEPAQPRGPNRIPTRDRINMMRRELGDRDRMIEDLRRQNEDLMRQTGGLAQRTQASDNAAFDAHVANWSGKYDAAKGALATAKKNNDQDAETAATIALTEAASEMQAIRAFWANNPHMFNPDGTRKVSPPPQPQAQQRPQPQAQPQAQQQQQIQIPPDMATWIGNNPWINKDDPDFDAEMAEAATQFTSTLDARFKRQGRGAEIGTSAYFQDLDKMLAQEFPEAYETQPQRQQQQQRKPTMTRPNGAGVAPAQRQQVAQPAPGQPGSKTLRMTADEHDFAKKMIANGAYKYPIGHPRAGQRMDEKDGLRYHAQHIVADQERQKALGKA